MSRKVVIWLIVFEHHIKYQVRLAAKIMNAMYDSKSMTGTASYLKPLEYCSRDGTSAIMYLLSGNNRNQRNEPGI